MNKRNLILQTAIAASFGLASVSAFATATSTLTGFVPAAATYATEGIPASGAVTIQAGITYSSTAALTADAGLVTFTLPAGVTFVTTPTATADATGFKTAVLGGGGAGSNFVTYNVTTGAAVGTITLGAFQVTGATGLATAGTNLAMTAQASGFTTAANNDTAARSTSATATVMAASGSQLNAAVVGAAATIDVTSPANGMLYLAGGSTITRSGYVGSVNAVNNAYLNSTATAPYAFTSTTASVAISADYSGISSVYAVTPAAACAATAPAGAKIATIAGSTATIAGLTPNTVYGVCFINTGANLMRRSANMIVTATQDSSSKTAAATLGSISYNGGVWDKNYVVGSVSGGYTNYIRVTNPDATARRLIVVVTKDDGTTTSGTLDAGLAAGNAKLYTVADINAATGSTLTSATDRARVTILSPSTTMMVDNLMFNPNGTVVPMP
jgi:hypothetical protein